MRKFKFSLVAFAILFLSSFAKAQEVYTDNVVIVFDDSGSMAESMHDSQGGRVDKIDAAKEALYEVLKQIPETTHIGLVTFRKGWVYPLGPKDDSKLKVVIYSLGAGGGTPLGKYMKKGADALLLQRERQHNYGSYRLLVVTDGEAGDKTLVKRYTPDIMSRGVTLDVIGVKMASRHTLSQYAHSYREANDPKSLQKAIQEVFSEVSIQDNTVFDPEDFDGDISGIPSEVASVIIEALSNTGNHPIGTKPKPIVSQETASPNVQSQSTQPTTPVANADDFPVGKFLLIFLIIVAVVVLGGVVLSSGRY